MAFPKDVIRFLRGSLSNLASAIGVMLEGEPCQLRLIDPTDSRAFAMQLNGGHDGENKVLGGGFQTIAYAGPPQFVVPPDLVGNGVGAVVDSDCNLWISSDGSCSCAVAVPGTGTGTGIGTGTGVGYWCKIAGCGGGGGGSGFVKEIDAEAPIVALASADGSTVTISHAISGVTPGTYTSPTITLDEWGHVTEATNGSSTSPTSRLYLTCATASLDGIFTLQTVYSYTAPAATMSHGTGIRCRAAGNIQSVSSTNILIALAIKDNSGNWVQVASCDQRNSIYNAGTWSIEFELLLDGAGAIACVGTFALSQMGAETTVTESFPSLPGDGSLEIALLIQPNDASMTTAFMAVWEE